MGTLAPALAADRFLDELRCLKGSVQPERTGVSRAPRQRPGQPAVLLRRAAADAARPRLNIIWPSSKAAGTFWEQGRLRPSAMTLRPSWESGGR
jgi:hypothetical protein